MERYPLFCPLVRATGDKPVDLSKKDQYCVVRLFSFSLTEQTIEQIVKLPVILCPCDATVMFVW